MTETWKPPRTQAEAKALQAALTHGEGYRVSLDLVVTVLDEEALRRAVQTALESARFSTEQARRSVTERVGGDVAEALHFILQVDGIFADESAVFVRSAHVLVQPQGAEDA
ncbi:MULTISPECIES: hypothetical protein [Actinosynnema]|uniref:hypothetical protein n=1 Tax=Actinosynnema TaxID=40566 RepID=UPI0020A4B7E2|nr:hypothetical protein [Actinosynnema pretiosum]MCP2098546.1 hypothetical protein [Actinosynnema pretiosum]